MVELGEEESMPPENMKILYLESALKHLLCRQPSAAEECGHVVL